MPNSAKGKATICMVNYRTLEMTRLALRCIRKFTKYPYELIVVDNDSNDKSLEYLKSLKWIRLIQRKTDDDVSPSRSHSAALELGYENCNTEFFVSMHSDALVRMPDWLTDLVGYFGEDEKIACVGSGKLELKPKWRVLLKRATDLRAFVRKLLRTQQRTGKNRYYNRTICCLYRTAILRNEGLSFLTDQQRSLTSGEKLYFELVDRGYPTVELPPSVMGRYVMHLSHATQVVNVEEFGTKRRTVRKTERLIAKVLSSPMMQTIMADDSLDN